MRRRCVGVWLLFIAVAAAVSAQAMDVREVGVRIDLALQPLYENGAARWDFAVGGYALVDISGAWTVRAGAGYDLLGAGPYLSLGAARSVTEHIWLEGDVSYQWSFSASGPTIAADAGIRFTGPATGTTRSELAIFPASWTLASRQGAPLAFAFSPSFTLYGAVAPGSDLLFGEAVTVTFLRVPSPSVQPVWDIGGGWMLAARLATHFGYIVPAT